MNTENDIAIAVNNIEKSFKLPLEQSSGIKQVVVNALTRKSGYEVQQVLNDVSFEIKKGEFFGIVGRNGSGKSTLLKLIASIYTPDKGEIVVNGSLTPFIELGVGFNPELTGRENIFMNGALLGFNHKEMEAMYEEIVDFAELHRFMDQKLKNYSSGMQVRLAFSIAIRAKTDILVLDEVLAVGDAAFQQKCYDVFAELKKAGTTIVLVTHDMGAVLRFCDRAVLIEAGKVVNAGKPTDIADAYLNLNFKQKKKVKKDELSAVDVETYSIDNKVSHLFDPGDDIILEIDYKNKEKTKTHIGVQIFNDEGVYCFGTNTSVDGLKPFSGEKIKVTMNLKADLAPGNYSFTVAIMNENATTSLIYKPKAVLFRVSKTVRVEGVALLDYTWKSN